MSAFYMHALDTHLLCIMALFRFGLGLDVASACSSSLSAPLRPTPPPARSTSLSILLSGAWRGRGAALPRLHLLADLEVVRVGRVAADAAVHRAHEAQVVRVVLGAAVVVVVLEARVEVHRLVAASRILRLGRERVQPRRGVCAVAVLLAVVGVAGCGRLGVSSARGAGARPRPVSGASRRAALAPHSPARRPSPSA